mgnify:CR=1 FL=1
MADLTREVFAELRLTYYKNGELEAAWPDDEMVTRFLLSKATDAYNQHIRKQAMLAMMQQQRDAVQLASEDTLKRLNGGKGRHHG